MFEEFEQVAARGKVDKKKVKPYQRVKLVPHGTPNAVSIEVGTPFWIKRFCVFKDSSGAPAVRSYSDWFFKSIDNHSSNIADSLNKMLDTIDRSGQVLLACDRNDDSGHGVVIRDYLIWAHDRRLKQAHDSVFASAK